MSNDFEPKKSLWFQHLANFSEVLTYFAGGLAGSFAVLWVPELGWFVVIAYLSLISYFLATKVNTTVFWLRIGALFVALLIGFKELFLLFPVHSVVGVLLLVAIAFLLNLIQRAIVGGASEAQQ